MTISKALEASQALDAIDGFKDFIEKVSKAVNEAEEFSLLNPEFKIALNELMGNELARLNKVLTDL